MPHQFKKVLRVPLLSSSRKAGVAQRWLLQLCVMPFFKYDMLLFEASSHGEMMMVNAYALNLDRHEEDRHEEDLNFGREGPRVVKLPPGMPPAPPSPGLDSQEQRWD